MTTYNPILDAEIDPESPVTESLARRWRDNPIAIAEGYSSAPRINPAGISIGGKGADGTFGDGTTITLPGYVDFENGARTIDLALPFITIMRFAGNFVSGAAHTWTVPCLSRTLATNLAQLEIAQKVFDAAVGNSGTGSPGASPKQGGGGGSIGAGGQGSVSSPGGLAGPVLSNVFRPWLTRRVFIGGPGGLTQGGGAGQEWGPGGGHLTIIVEGDFDASNLIINADGGDTNDTGAGSDSPGGGGAGSIIVLATGNIQNGTFRARGGKGNNGGTGGGGGGGGWVQLIANGFLGTQTFDVSGGTGTSANGVSGYSNSTTLQADYIRTLIARLR